MLLQEGQGGRRVTGARTSPVKHRARIEPGTTGERLQVLRLILNMIPTNSILKLVTADVGLLPFFAQWLNFELAEEMPS